MHDSGSMRALRPWTALRLPTNATRWHRLAAVLLVAAAGPAGAEPPARPPEPTAVTLERAIELAVARSPELAGHAAEVRAREARTRQQGLPPNPEVRAEVENISGSGIRTDAQATQSTVWLAQRFELGGKRAGRRRVAELDATLATWDLEEKRLAVVAATTKAFVETLAAQERVRLADALHEVAERAVAAVAARVDAGGASPVEVARARVDAARASAARAAAAQELAARRSQLAAAWGEPAPAFARVAGDLARLPPLPSLAALRAASERSPALARWETEVAEREAAVTLARSGRVPDVTIGAGGRYFSDVEDGALVLDVIVPLPLFDRNQGAVAEAAARLGKARSERDAARVATAAAVASLHARLAGARVQAERLGGEIVPEAARALDGTLAGYRRGLAGLGDVLQAQRAVFELRAEHVTALETAHVLTADLDRLTAAAGAVEEGAKP